MRELSKICNRNKGIIILGVVIGFVILTGFSYLFIWGSYIETQSIVIKQIEVTDDNLRIKGTTINSATGFSGYNYKMKDQNLYLRLRYCLVNRINPSGDFDIKILDDLKNINKVYVQGEQNFDKKMIWSR